MQDIPTESCIHPLLDVHPHKVFTQPHVCMTHTERIVRLYTPYVYRDQYCIDGIDKQCQLM